MPAAIIALGSQHATPEVGAVIRERGLRGPVAIVRAGYQEREADGKWKRAQLTSAQLATYFVGAQEHVDMRKAVEAKLGDKFDLKAYHDKVLSYGAPPVRFVRELMLDQPIR